MCVYIRERERECVCVSVCECVWMGVCACVRVCVCARERETVFITKSYRLMMQDCTLGDTLWSSMQTQGLSHHLMRRGLSQEEGERGEHVCMRIHMCDM